MKAREGLAVIVVIVMIGLAFVAGGTIRPKVTTTRTITFTSPTGGGPVIEEVIVQPVVTNDVCVLYFANQTTTYLLRVGSNAQASTTVTTETLNAVNAVTFYENASIISGGSTCTEINPHYNATQTTPCGPCA